MTARAAGVEPPAPVDRDGLLCALAIAPSTYSRNKHPTLYESDDARRVHRRARLLRGLARQLARHGGTFDAAPGGFVVRIEIPHLGYKREARLSPIERDLVTYLVARSEGRPGGDELARIEGALARLAG